MTIPNKENSKSAIQWLNKQSQSCSGNARPSSKQNYASSGRRPGVYLCLTN